MNFPTNFLLVVACLGDGVWSFKDGQLANKNIKVVAQGWCPFLCLQCPNGIADCPIAEEKIYSGILWELLMFMKQAKNLSYTMMGIDDAFWGGTCYDSNNCTGMVVRVNRGEADIALGLYYIFIGRASLFRQESPHL